MPSPESKPTVYAQPYAKSEDPATRGHITGGWVESDKLSLAWGEGGDPTITRRLRGPNGEVLDVNESDHVRLQAAMGNLAAAAIARQETDGRSPGGTPSAEAQLREQGIISEVPGAQSRTPEVRISTSAAELAQPTRGESDPGLRPESAASVIEQSSVPKSISEQLDVAHIRERAKAGTFDQAVLAIGLYRTIDGLLQREPTIQYADQLRQIKSNLLAVSAMGRDPRTAQGMGGALLGQLNNIDNLI